MNEDKSNLPAQIAEALVAIPKGLTPSVLKSLDRLLGATVDIPVAWLQQKRAKIDAQTASFNLVEASIAASVASDVGADPQITDRALNVLVRKEYRKQLNREEVARAMLQELDTPPEDASKNNDHADVEMDISDDWLNIFERYAEDASSERLQNLWGRVLAGEVRSPGKFSLRTLRFLSEFSQADALTFETFANSVFADAAPKSLVSPKEKQDIRELINLEASGLIQGATGLGLTKTITVDKGGLAFLKEGSTVIAFKGNPGTKFTIEVLVLTPLGQELLCLLSNRNCKEIARAFAYAVRVPEMHDAFICSIDEADPKKSLKVSEVIWMNEAQDALEHRTAE